MKQDDFDNIWSRVKSITGWRRQNDLADFLDVQSTGISEAKGKGLFREKWALKIAKEFGTTADFILYGDGQNEKHIDIKKNTPPVIPQREKPDPETYFYVPMAEAQLSAGGGMFVLSEEISAYYAFRKDWLNRIATSAKSVVLMAVNGNSMHPTIQNKDTVLIDTGRQTILEGLLYAIRLDSTIMIKRLTHRPGDIINVVSDNKDEFETYQAKRSEIHVIGQIIHFSRDLANS